jgi:transcriptional regulator with XRE-family HTH domain
MSDEFVDSTKLGKNFERNKQILTMIEEGYSYAQIGREIGLTRARVSQIAIDNGYVVRPSLVNLNKRKVDK